MRLAAALLITLLASTANAMPPQQQAVWEIMQNLAPSYESMQACGREFTAELIETMVADVAIQIVTSDADLEIIEDMWREARRRAYFDFFEVLAELRQNPNGEDCARLELLLVQRLRQGV